MNIDAVLNLLNFNTTVETLEIYTDAILSAIVRAALSLKSAFGSLDRPLSSPFVVEFTELQFALLKVFGSIFFINLLLIGIYWRKYGKIITDRFIRPSTLKEIEELKLSVAKLKLPKEHSPRI